MANSGKTKSLFKRALRGNIYGQRKITGSTDLSPEMQLLRQFQAERLKETYADLMESERYGRTTQFFLTDIYGAKDFSQRDADAEEAYNSMRKYLPDRLLTTMGKAVELNRLTKELDEQMLHILINDLDMTDELTPEMYAEAYRIQDNYDERVTQLDLIMDIGQGVDNLTRIPMIGLILRASRRPARRAGWEALQDFLGTGFQTFKQMGGADEFLGIVAERERRILDQIFAGDPHPFDTSKVGN